MWALPPLSATFVVLCGTLHPSGGTAMERRLAAILFADVAGYSRLMGADEAATLSALKTRFAAIERLVAAHRGRVFATAGDSIAAEFVSAVEALHAAVEIQQESERRAPGADSPLRLRIGLNLGDVMADGDNLFGDGVNVAARIQALAPPGQICISPSLLNQVKNKVPFAFEDLGRHRLKNIAEPLTVYRVLTDPGMAATTSQRLLAKLRRQRVLGAIAACLLLALIGAGIGVWFSTGSEAPAAPGIAVLPLSSLDGDEATSRLADGLTEDIITDLARFKDLIVIARNSTMVYKGDSVDAREVGREFDVGYVLLGTIQRQGDDMRISAQLVDAGSGATIWAERWDRPVADTFAVQTEIAERVAGSIGSINGIDSIAADQVKKLKRRQPVTLTAYENYLLAVEAKGTFTKEALEAGIAAATKAIELDPTFARAYAVRARLEFNTSHYGVPHDVAMQQMHDDARKGVDLDPNDPETRAAWAWYLFNKGQIIEGETEIRAALAANPANINVLIFAAAIIASNGHPEEGAALADKVLRIDPRASAGSLNTIKDAYFFAHRFDDLIAVVNRLPIAARSKGSRLFLAFSYALLGKKTEAAAARADLLQKFPAISAELLMNQGWVYPRPEDQELFLDGFRAADVPLCAKPTDLAAFSNPVRLPECQGQQPG